MAEQLHCRTKLNLDVPAGLPNAPLLLADMRTRRRKFEWKGVPVEEIVLPWGDGRRMVIWVFHSLERGYFDGQDKAGVTRQVLNPLFTCDHPEGREIEAVELVRAEFERHWGALASK